ncbi:site-specific integrase [Desulfobacterota bacterium AH_259_B03_O07]|nr:site-specific integrase [Desulfobacterota bacterium AH_259_B03_O07]
MKTLDQYESEGRAFIALMNLSGMRISEDCSLKTGHLVREKDGHRSEYLFPGKKKGHVHRTTGWRWSRQFKGKAGYNGKLIPHKLRHTFATRLYRKETPIFDLQNMLGHADPRTTGIYAHIDYEALQTHIQKLL